MQEPTVVGFCAGFQEQNASLGSGELQTLAGGNYELSTSPDSQGAVLTLLLNPPIPSPPPQLCHPPRTTATLSTDNCV